MNSSATCSTSCHQPAGWALPFARLLKAVASRLERHLAARRKLREFDFADELSADTLRDIGAPEAMVSRAMQQRESQRVRLSAMRQWRDG